MALQYIPSKSCRNDSSNQQQTFSRHLRQNRKLSIETLLEEIITTASEKTNLKIDKKTKTNALLGISAYHENSVSSSTIKKIQSKDPSGDRKLPFNILIKEIK